MGVSLTGRSSKRKKRERKKRELLARQDLAGQLGTVYKTWQDTLMRGRASSAAKGLRPGTEAWDRAMENIDIAQQKDLQGLKEHSGWATLNKEYQRAKGGDYGGSGITKLVRNTIKTIGPDGKPMKVRRGGFQGTIYDYARQHYKKFFNKTAMMDDAKVVDTGGGEAKAKAKAAEGQAEGGQIDDENMNPFLRKKRRLTGFGGF
jgi:hypothetical protein